MKRTTLLKTLLVAVGLFVGMNATWGAKIGFTSTYDGSGKILAPTVTSQANLTVTIVHGDQVTDKNKGSMYWGSASTALSYADGANVIQSRTKYNNAAVGTTLNDHVWTGASFAIASGYKFTVTDIQVDIAGQDYSWKYRLDIVNGDGTVKKSISGTAATPKNNSKRQVTASEQSIELTGTSYVKLYYCLESSTSDSKYMYVPELYLTGTIEVDDTPSYTMTAAVDNASHGTASVSSASVLEGGSVTFTATKNAGYKFVNWTNTVGGSVASTSNPYTIASVTGDVSLTANFTDAYSINYSVSDGSRGTTTTGLETEYANDADKFTAPANYYIYKANSTLTSWKDGDENSYTPGTEYTLTKNITLVPVFTANTKTLSDRTAQTVVTWSFNYVGGEAPAISIEGNTGYYIKQATIDGVKTDIVMAIDNTTGSAIAGVKGKTVNNSEKFIDENRQYAQVNRGAKWTIPAVKGMTIVAYSASGNFLNADNKTDPDESKWKYATRIAGVVASSGTGTTTATWVYNGEAATIDYVAGNDAGYISKIVVTYPSPYSVTYDGNGATSGSTTDAATYDKNASVTAQSNGFTKIGYVFIGWNTKADGSGTALAAGGTFSITGNTTLYAQWTAGTEATVTYTLNVNTAEASIGTASKNSSDANLASLSNLTNNGSLTIESSAKADLTSKIGAPSSYDADKYMSVSFTVSDGYLFTPTAISVKAQPVSNNGSLKLVLTDGVSSIEKTQDVSKGNTTTVSMNNSSKITFTNNVTLKVYCYGTSTGTYRLGSPITITGSVCSEVDAAIADCKAYETSSAFATAVDAETFATPAEVYAFHSAWQVTQAQTNGSTDYSKAIMNRTFELHNTNGWTIYGDVATSGTTDNDKYGVVEYGDGWSQYYTGWNGRNVSQTIASLPAGTYTLTAKVYSWGDPGASVRLFANGTLSDTEAGTDHDPVLVFTVAGNEPSIKIGIGGTGNNDDTDNTWGTWGYRVKNFTLTKNVVSGTITDAGWSTFASSKPLDLSSISGGTAYYASEATGNTVTLSTTTATVPAGEGLMIKGTAGETFTIGVAASGTSISGNLLKGQTTTGNVAASGTDGKYHYVFGFNTADPSIYGFYNLASTTSVPAGKAYLETTSALSAARVAIVFEDEEATGIADVRDNMGDVNGNFYDLSGRKVAQPSKGLYIVNGKKVIIK